MTSEEMEPDVDPPLLPIQGTRSIVTTTNTTKTSARQSATRSPPQSQHRDDLSRSQLSTRSAARDASSLRRPLPTSRRNIDRNASTATKTKSYARASRTVPTTKSKPLLPASERRNQEQKQQPGRQRKNSDTDRWDITPDGGSAGREGRQFTVANVGNNGRIYLRPTVRPAHQRYPQPNFVFPITPPQTAGLGAAANAKDDKDKRPGVQDHNASGDSQWTPSQVPSTPTTPGQRLHSLLKNDKANPRLAHRRALSDSTIHESSVARESDPNGFKIVITKPGDHRRPKTVQDIDPITQSTPLLDIIIPSWKLGTPRWSARGTPLIRGSSYAPTEDLRSSRHSVRTPRFDSSMPSHRPGSIARISYSHGNPHTLSAGLSPTQALRTTYLSTHMVIEAAMFDALTFKPACDDGAIVRYSATTGAVTAATPPRLVAEITSPSFLDYELLSDFFLTFRAFLGPLELLQMLFARMRWALARHDEVGMVVRVRTFVALRHWILNYFVDDFVCDYDMRTNFCTLLNSLADEMTNCPKARRVQIKILAELKKCWRRVCAQFWDGPEFDVNLAPEAPVGPGGIPGHRDPGLSPDFWKKFLNDGPPQLDNVYAPLTGNPPETETSFLRDVAHAGQNAVGFSGQERPGTPDSQVATHSRFEESQLSPISISSAEAVSCSIPKRLAGSGPRRTPAAHPVDPNSIHKPGTIATAPRNVTGKRVRPQHSHKRDNSTSDSVREHQEALEEMLQKNTETLLSIPYVGSLVRGNVLPPGQAFVEVLSPSSRNGPSRQTTYLRVQQDESAKDDKCPPSAMSGQGMRKLIGSVRRALSTRGQEMSPTQGNFNISPIGPRGVTTNRLPSTAIVPQAHQKADTPRPLVRIDLLGAEIIEEFKRVVREDAVAEAAARSFHGSIPSTPSTVRAPGERLEFDTARIDSLLRVPPENEDLRPFSDTEVTTGSKSILIFDDTLRVPNELPAMTGALPAFNPSVEAFAESFMPQGADPTPPSTPPGGTTDTPRRSSYLLGQHMPRSVRSADDLPPFVPDLSTLGLQQNLRQSEEVSRPSLGVGRPSSEVYRQSLSRPFHDGLLQHKRYSSSKSVHSHSNMVLRRHASYQSGLRPLSTARSFDASTASERNSMDETSQIPAQPPLRMLRRRPGGDLRAVNNVVELGHAELRRSRSMGSLTTFTDSLGTSLIRSPRMARESTSLVEVVSSDYSRERMEVFSLGVMTEKRKRKISLLSAFSSKPVMRPSFEAEAQKLANIPDDDDDGGVESALLKLEGKYQRKVFKLSIEPKNSPLKVVENVDRNFPNTEDDPCIKAEKKKHRHEHIGDDGVVPYSPVAGESQPFPAPSLAKPIDEKPPSAEAHSLLSARSNESYTSIPILEREMTDDGRRSRAAWTNQSILEGPEDDAASSLHESTEVVLSSHEPIEESHSADKNKSDHTWPLPEASSTRDSHQSFLDLDTDDDELSSEMSDNPVEEDEDLAAFPSLRPDAANTQTRMSERESRPATARYEPSPPPAQKFTMAPKPAESPDLDGAQIFGVKPLPPTPEHTPTFETSGPGTKTTPDPTGINEALRNAADVIEHEATIRKYSAHLPFVLAFDSDVLAQQFTLIEKDALNEIDWKELIDMRWKNADNNDCRSWVQFLRDTDARGVEVVIARFNIAVKWAISEIVLTQNIEERARCIIKCIHIAAHCRRYRNFATMSQLAVALTSREVSRLSRTWNLVPASDLRTLREFEALISPTRNFYALRSEMEGGGLASADTGCIPFVGIYTHDLIFNSQRPSEIASSPTTAPLVNFERCRIAAGIVKALLRLLEASAVYNFQPIEGITERCLWLSALTDEEIRRHSERLE